jgi:sulfur-oxidizing protein SoxY
MTMTFPVLDRAMPRRQVLRAAAGAVLLTPLPVVANEAQVAALIRELAGEGAVNKGRVKLDIPLLVENGNAVPMTVVVDSSVPVRSLHVFAERNPLPHVANFYFGPRAGPPKVSTRIRLATSQTVIAVAKLADGSCWSNSLELIVTLAACVE